MKFNAQERPNTMQWISGNTCALIRVMRICMHHSELSEAINRVAIEFFVVVVDVFRITAMPQRNSTHWLTIDNSATFRP